MEGDFDKISSSYDVVVGLSCSAKEICCRVGREEKRREKANN